MAVAKYRRAGPLLLTFLMVSACGGKGGADDDDSSDAGGSGTAGAAGDDGAMGSAGDGDTDDEPGTDSDPRTIGGSGNPGNSVDPPASCQASSFETTCPERPCEVLVGCEDDVCVYSAISCIGGGAVCPVLACEATEKSGGGYTNECIAVTGAACGNGGVCQGTTCEVNQEGLRASGHLVIGPHEGSLTDSAMRQFQVSGHLGFTAPSHGPVASGSLRVTGGLRP